MEEIFKIYGKSERSNYVITPVRWWDVAISFYVEGFYKKRMVVCNEQYMLTCRAEADESENPEVIYATIYN